MDYLCIFEEDQVIPYRAGWVEFHGVGIPGASAHIRPGQAPRKGRGGGGVGEEGPSTFELCP